MIDIFKEQSDGMVLALDNLSKAYLQSIAEDISNSVFNGNEYALPTYIKAKGLEEIAKAIQESIKELAIDDAHDYRKDEKVLGCEFLVKNTPTTYDFSHNDEWRILNDEITKLKAQQKEIEKQMILAMGMAQMVNTDGVVIEPAVVKKDGGQTIQINIPK
jgi:phosphoenolpyruvate synthase/pyruvate phosphate dikinase